MKFNSKFKFLLIILWALIIFILAKNNLLTADVDSLELFLVGNESNSMLLFVLLWVVRIFVFIPGFIFMIIGGALFESTNGFLLSLAGIALSETIIFFISKSLIGYRLQNLLNKKYPDVTPLLKRYNGKFLTLGIICPIAPTDAICFLSAAAEMSYKKFIITVVAANTPVILAYSYFGTSFDDSLLGTVTVGLTIVLFTILTYRIWKNIKEKAAIG